MLRDCPGAGKALMESSTFRPADRSDGYKQAAGTGELGSTEPALQAIGFVAFLLSLQMLL